LHQHLQIKMTKFSTVFIAAAAAALATSAADAWSTESPASTRRQAFGMLGAGAAALLGASQEAGATAPRTGASSPFTGDYDDPNHPNCLRQVKVVGAPLKGDGTRSAYPVMEITGFDGKGSGATCTDRPERADLWKVQGTVKSNSDAVIDFSPKGGPAKLTAKFEDGGIVFPDGNKWTKVAMATNSRRPADMSTLKSN
jgi:hypothetical protein